MAVRGYGEAEFWLSGGKVILIFLLFSYTFVTMCGGNPDGEAYGFSNWNSPGPFVEANGHTGALGRFEGFLVAMWAASFAIVGPEYISMVAAEAQRPRIYIKTAFKTIYLRFGIFFVGSALFVGIVLAANDQGLVDILTGNTNDASGGSAASASPYVIAMGNFGINGLPHLVNALLLTSIFSAGNTYTYCATRTLYGLALEGRAPRFLRKCTSNGVPINCFFIVILFPFLSLLQVSNGSAEVLGWLVSLITAGGLIDFLVMSLTFIFFYRACKAQGLDRKTLPYYGYFQPYGAYLAFGFQFLVVIFYGYTSFTPWSVESFFRNYTMQLVAPCLFVGWKVIKKTRFVKPHEADLVWEKPTIDAYEASLTEPPTAFWMEMGELVGIKKRKKNVSEA
jgi:amino acid transporter